MRTSRPSGSALLTWAFLAGAAVVLAVGWMLSRPADRSVATRPARYRVLPAPFPAGEIRGKVFAPPGAPVPRPPSLPGCPRPAAAGDGGVPDAVVRIEGIVAGRAAPDDGPAIRLEACGFEPRAAVGLEGRLARIESEGAGHRLQAMTGGVRLFDGALDRSAAISLVGPGPIELRCYAGHDGEEASVYVLDHPYGAVTEADGSFSLRAVPVGEHRLVVWHPTYGERETAIHVAVGRSTEVELRY